VLIDGRATSALGERELTELRRNHTGFVFQFFQLLPTLSSLESVELPQLLARVPKARDAGLGAAALMATHSAKAAAIAGVRVHLRDGRIEEVEGG
jgi:ABC-type lipoprotein export system ATPase subunit